MISKRTTGSVNNSTSISTLNTERGLNNKRKSYTKHGTVISAISINDVLYVICKLDDGSIAGQPNNIKDVTLAECLIPCDTSFVSMWIMEKQAIGMKVDIRYVGNIPVSARMSSSVTGGDESTMSPFGISRKDIWYARSVSKDHTLDNDAQEYLKDVGYSDSQINGLLDAKLEKIEYNGNVLNLGDSVRYGITHVDDTKGEVSLPDTTQESVAKPPPGKLKKKNCYKSPVVFSGR